MITALYLSHFRNFSHRHLHFHKGLQAIVGPNTSGKTTILEALYFASIGRSFKTQRPIDMIQYGTKAFVIEISFIKDEIEQNIRISYDEKYQKEIRYNQSRYTLFTPLLGIFPTVLSLPMDSKMIYGSSEERRKFLNILLAQSHPVYVHHLNRYRKALMHRNALLKQNIRKTIEIWERELIQSGHYLQQQRSRSIDLLNRKVQTIYHHLFFSTEEVLLVYRPSEATERDFNAIREKEILLGTTLIGAHKDDFLILIQGKSAKQFTSEGQKRTFLIILKLAESSLLSSSLLLIDDFGIHLDKRRQQIIEQYLQEYPQVCITSPYCTQHISKNIFITE